MKRPLVLEQRRFAHQNWRVFKSHGLCFRDSATGWTKRHSLLCDRVQIMVYYPSCFICRWAHSVRTTTRQQQDQNECGGVVLGRPPDEQGLPMKDGVPSLDVRKQSRRGRKLKREEFFSRAAALQEFCAEVSAADAVGTIRFAGLPFLFGSILLFRFDERIICGADEEQHSEASAAALKKRQHDLLRAKEEEEWVGRAGHDLTNFSADSLPARRSDCEQELGKDVNYCEKVEKQEVRWLAVQLRSTKQTETRSRTGRKYYRYANCKNELRLPFFCIAPRGGEDHERKIFAVRESLAGRIPQEIVRYEDSQTRMSGRAVIEELRLHWEQAVADASSKRKLRTRREWLNLLEGAEKPRSTCSYHYTLELEEKLYSACGFELEFPLGKEEHAVHNSYVGGLRTLHRTISHRTCRSRKYESNVIDLTLSDPDHKTSIRPVTVHELRRIDLLCAIEYCDRQVGKPLLGVYLFPQRIVESFFHYPTEDSEATATRNGAPTPGKRKVGRIFTVHPQNNTVPRIKSSQVRKQQQLLYYIDLRPEASRDVNLAKAKRILSEVVASNRLAARGKKVASDVDEARPLMGTTKV
ncbi:unnamed protein product [Amoebophrya sp. A120]|nr:unnamed protein product [Amoebophrya sp. A120]|eukprot:GSA120T00009760001.1